VFGFFEAGSDLLMKSLPFNPLRGKSVSKLTENILSDMLSFLQERKE